MTTELQAILVSPAHHQVCSLTHPVSPTAVPTGLFGRDSFRVRSGLVILEFVLGFLLGNLCHISGCDNTSWKCDNSHTDKS